MLNELFDRDLIDGVVKPATEWNTVTAEMMVVSAH